MASLTKLQFLLTQWKHHDAIPVPSVFAPSSLVEPSPKFPATLSRDHLLSNRVSDVLESKLTELAPSLRKQVFLKEIGYIGCSAENVAYLVKKDVPGLVPTELNVTPDILFLTSIQYDWLSPGKDVNGEAFLAIVTEREMHCYEVCPMENGEDDFVPSFSVESPEDDKLSCMISVSGKRVFCGTEKGAVYELKPDNRAKQPHWVCIGSSDEEVPRVKALYLDEDNGLLYALFEDSSVDVFFYRQTEPARRMTGFRPQGQVSFVALFPMANRNSDTANLLAVASDGFLFNFEIDMRQTRATFRFVKKFLRTASSTQQPIQQTNEASCIATRLETEGASERKLLGVGFFEGLVMAVPRADEGNHAIDLYSISRLPTDEEGTSYEAANAMFVREPIRLNGHFVSMHAAVPDENMRLFNRLDLGRDELSRQVFLKGHKFIILTGTRVIDVRKRCPVEILMEILQVRDPERLDEFFQFYGNLETATMAVQLAVSRGDEPSRRLLLDDHRLSTMLFSTEGHSGELSIPARAILTYFRRLISPIWEKPLFSFSVRKEGLKVNSVLTLSQQEWFSCCLDELERFIGMYLDEFHAVRFFDGTVLTPKCPSITPEFELLCDLQDVIVKCREILCLVKIFEEAKPVLLKDHQLKILSRMPLESYAFTVENPKAPLQELIQSILTSKDKEVQEDIIYKLDRELPILSKSKDRIYEKAMSYLRKAKNSPRPERQEILVNKAMNLLGDNSEEYHIDPVVTALTDLQRHYEILQFVSRTAKKLVPEPPTSDPDVQKKAHFLRRRCYDRAFSYVSNYIQQIDPDDDESTDIPVLFGAVQCLDDMIMMEMMMEKLLSSNKIPRRAMHQPSFFEFGNELRRYLSKKVMNVSGIHEVSEHEGVRLSDAAQHEMRLLVEICQSQGDLKQAGDWLMILAKRQPVKRNQIPLIERIGDLNDARAMYDTVMPETFLRSLEKEIELAMFQQRVLTMGKRIFAIMDDVMDNGRIVRAVLTKLADVDTLYRVIRDNFPMKIAQDMTNELQRITGGSHPASEVTDITMLET